MSDDLNIEQYFSATVAVPEPRHSSEELKKIDDLGAIGQSQLSSSGFYVRIFSAAPSGKSRRPSECTVLVVEDDAGTADVIVKSLQRVGYAVRQAQNRAETASGLAAKPRPDLVLLDVLLPDVNGFELLNRIRQHPALKSIPVLMLTSLDDSEHVAKGLTLGANGYITKPVMPSTLLDAVKSIVTG